MTNLIGFTSILLVSLITLFIALKYPSISKIILVALLVRIFVIILGHYLIVLPDSTKDAIGFENLAWDWGSNGLIYTLDQFPGFNSYFYSWIIALLYSLVGRSVLMVQSISLLLGIFSVLLSWLIVKKMWGDNAAKKAGWILALFPSLILYSILPLREAYNIFFLTLAIYGIVNWVEKDDVKSIIITLSGFVGASLFHAVLLVGGIIFLFFVGLQTLKKSFRLILIKRISIKNTIFLGLFVFYFALYFSNAIYIPYLGTFEQSIDLHWIKHNMTHRMTGDASYAEWTSINSGLEFFYKGIFRVVYFLFSPFPWDVKKITHWFGVIDSFFYMAIIFLILLNLKKILKDRTSRTILLILLIYLFIYGIGVNNFGAGIRHRAKFIVGLLFLAVPFIPNFIFLNKLKPKK